MRALLLLLTLALTASAQSLNGRWDAVIDIIDLKIPFRLDLEGNRGSFFNGDQKLTSSSGHIGQGKLDLHFDIYNSTLQGTFADGVFQGNYTRMGHTYPVRATRYVPSKASAAVVPKIAGNWQLGDWPLVIRQSGQEASAAILRVDGDTGALTGIYRDGKFILSHFSGSRPALLELTPHPDGTLTALSNGKPLPVVRAADAQSKPEDPTHHTTMKDPSEPFRFAFPDLNGKLVSNTDPQFKDKVVIVSIGGSWCPNCHDEAPFLGELYRRFHAKGLEMVDLSFEDADELKDPVRVRAYIKRYGIEYPVLLAGEVSELQARIPQPVHLDSYPTTFFIGRDGRVREIHAGFAGAATGEFHIRLKAEVTALVERLLAEDMRR